MSGQSHNLLFSLKFPWEISNLKFPITKIITGVGFWLSSSIKRIYLRTVLQTTEYFRSISVRAVYIQKIKILKIYFIYLELFAATVYACTEKVTIKWIVNCTIKLWLIAQYLPIQTPLQRVSKAGIDWNSQQKSNVYKHCYSTHMKNVATIYVLNCYNNNNNNYYYYYYLACIAPVYQRLQFSFSLPIKPMKIVGNSALNTVHRSIWCGAKLYLSTGGRLWSGL